MLACAGTPSWSAGGAGCSSSNMGPLDSRTPVTELSRSDSESESRAPDVAAAANHDGGARGGGGGVQCGGVGDAGPAGDGASVLIPQSPMPVGAAPPPTCLLVPRGCLVLATGVWTRLDNQALGLTRTGWSREGPAGPFDHLVKIEGEKVVRVLYGNADQ